MSQFGRADAVEAIVRTKAHADDVRSLERVVAVKQPQPGRDGRGPRRSARDMRAEKARVKKAQRSAAAAAKFTPRELPAVNATRDLLDTSSQAIAPPSSQPPR